MLNRLAGVRRGRTWVNRFVPRSITVGAKRIDPRAKLRIHERVERKLMKNGLSYAKAHKIALKSEHRGMTRHQVAVYEGYNGAVARWHPHRRG